MMLATDLALALDPVAFAHQALGSEPDGWQAQLLRSTAPRFRESAPVIGAVRPLAAHSSSSRGTAGVRPSMPLLRAEAVPRVRWAGLPERGATGAWGYRSVGLPERGATGAWGYRSV